MTNLYSLSTLSGDIVISKNDEKVYSIGKKTDVNILNNFSRKESNIDLVSKDYSSVNLHLKPLIDTKPSIISGIPVSHQHSINQVANDENIIIGIRSIYLSKEKVLIGGLMQGLFLFLNSLLRNQLEKMLISTTNISKNLLTKEVLFPLCLKFLQNE